jgi:hypothetical protein
MTYERVLLDFGPGRDTARRRRYRKYVEAGSGDATHSPFSETVEGLILDSETFVDRIKVLFANRSPDTAVPALDRLRVRPSLEAILEVALEQLGSRAEQWARGHRSGSGGRAVAAYVCRCRYGYGCTQIAKALGFRHASGVSRSVAWVEANLSGYREAPDRLERELTNRGKMPP